MRDVHRCWQATPRPLYRLVIGLFHWHRYRRALGLMTSTSEYFEEGGHDGAARARLADFYRVLLGPMALLWFGRPKRAACRRCNGTVWSDDGHRGARATFPPLCSRVDAHLDRKGFDKWTRVIMPASLPMGQRQKQGWDVLLAFLMAAGSCHDLTGFGRGHLLHYGRETVGRIGHRDHGWSFVLKGLSEDKIRSLPAGAFSPRRWARIEVRARSSERGRIEEIAALEARENIGKMGEPSGRGTRTPTQDMIHLL